MTHQRTKVVPLKNHKFHLRRLQPEVGSFIFMRMLGLSVRVAQDQPVQSKTESQPSEPRAEISGEMRVRALTFAAQSTMPFEDFKFVQQSCMKVASIVVSKPEGDFPMPIMTDEGAWTPNGADVAYDIGLVMQLTTEVMVFCFADFFDDSGHGSPT
jgi:hypothetical protein